MQNIQQQKEVDEEQLPYDYPAIRKAYRQGRLTKEEIAVLEAADFEFKIDIRQRVICVETGQVFESIVEAARWANTSVETIHQALRKGCLGSGYHWWYVDRPMPEGHLKNPRRKRVKCVETGQVFESVSAAARWAGVDLVSIQCAIKTGGIGGGYHWWWADEPMPPEGFFKRSQKKPVTCVETGQVFESVSAAAKWAGVDVGNLGRAIKKGTCAGGYHWLYADQPMPPEGFFKKKCTSKPVVCLETGQRFESIKAAARWAGVSPTGIRYAVVKGIRAGGYHWWWADEPLPPDDYFKKTDKHPVKCKETGQVFESVSAAARWAGLNNGGSNLSRAIRQGSRAGGYHWEYVQEGNYA